ncbi:MAG: UDP-N-acetylglucosamine 1-carboxyvinyltransferase [Lachnospiraceae bacterium]|nr:UDP-N-acetylglucosamine 1-carboxyvinyltransferase [Lachnospiraceae bacterium]
MGTIHIHGGIPLQGAIKIQGSKNAALPIMAATLLVSGKCLLKGCPRIADVFYMQKLLESLGCVTRWEGDAIAIEPVNICMGEMPADAVKGMRSSLTLLGALLGRCGKAALEYPGGCVIGKRPIDMHIKALKQMNVCFGENDSMLYAWSKKLQGGRITLECASVGATENIILAGVLAKGKTEIQGAAKEPEVVALCDFLKACGAQIEGAGTEQICIEGVEKLYGAEYEIPKDRIAAGTYVLACMAAGGEILLKNAPVKEMDALLDITEQMGAFIQKSRQEIYMQAPKRPKAVSKVQTAVYPGFPTDLQSPLLSVLAVADGSSEVKENIFENRFRIVPDLVNMGAKVQQVDARTVHIEGQERLKGAVVTARELRGGAALVIAGLSAQGETGIKDTIYIDRGYVNICRDLRELGARIYSV